LRRRYWRSLLGVFAVLVVIGGAISAFVDERDPIPRRILFSLALAVFCAVFAVNVATWFALMGFRCPRCGGRFILSWWSSWPSDRCKHCELDLGPTAMAAAKPTAAADPWEATDRAMIETSNGGP
jgi:hypothetical protein